MDFFETCPECSLPSTVSKNTIKLIGHHVRSRDVMDQSYPIYSCTRADHSRCSSVHVTFRGSWMHSLLTNTWKKNLTGRQCRVYGTISYEICRKIIPF